MKRARVQTRLPGEYDGSEEERDESSDGFQESRPKAKRHNNKAKNVAANVIKENGKQIPRAVKGWVERYERDKKPAMAELLMMLFEACGVKYQAEEELLVEIDVDNVVVALVNAAKNGEVEDYQS